MMDIEFGGQLSHGKPRNKIWNIRSVVRIHLNGVKGTHSGGGTILKIYVFQKT